MRADPRSQQKGGEKCRLAGRPTQGTAADDVQVEVEYGLSGPPSGVDHGSIAAFGYDLGVDAALIEQHGAVVFIESTIIFW